MKFILSILSVSIIGMFYSCESGTIQLNDSIIKAPVAKIISENLEIHGDVRVDNYFWLRDRENPQVIEYIKAENAYTDSVMSNTKALQETLFDEIKGRIKQDDASVPYKLDDFYYYSRFEEAQDYPLYC